MKRSASSLADELQVRKSPRNNIQWIGATRQMFYLKKERKIKVPLRTSSRLTLQCQSRSLLAARPAALQTSLSESLASVAFSRGSVFAVDVFHTQRLSQLSCQAKQHQAGQKKTTLFLKKPRYLCVFHDWLWLCFVRLCNRGCANFTIAAFQPAATRWGESSGISVVGLCCFWCSL